MWEDLALPATASFQEGIDAILGERPIDIAVFILWARLGSPLGPAVTRRDGSPYRSGTEREFDLMLAAFEQSGRKRPHILVYIRDDDSWRQRLVSNPAADLREMVSQQELVEGFITEHFLDDERRNTRAYYTYGEPISFAEDLATHLRRQLSDQLVVDAASPLWHGPPYRGLQVFDQEHTAIFYGREKETCELLHRLREQVLRAADGRPREVFPEFAAGSSCAFVLIVGASGSGKSSLARAGVAARLERSPYDQLVWRTVTFLPALHRENLCGGLVAGLVASVPELNMTPARIARYRRGPRARSRPDREDRLEPLAGRGRQGTGYCQCKRHGRTGERRPAGVDRARSVGGAMDRPEYHR